jgi:hypothetical protein
MRREADGAGKEKIMTVVVGVDGSAPSRLNAG